MLREVVVVKLSEFLDYQGVHPIVVELLEFEEKRYFDFILFRGMTDLPD